MQVKVAGQIAGLRIERSTQNSERERLLKEIGSKTFSIFSKKKSLDLQTLEEEILNELQLIERIDKRRDEIEVEIESLKEDLMKSGGKDVVDADEVKEAGDDESSAKHEKKQKG